MSLWSRFTKHRAEEHAEHQAHAHGATAEDLRKAYERGRREERARHTGHPVITLAVFVVALMGAGMVYLAAREGSFSDAGRIVDHKIAAATGKAQLASQDAASVVSRTGDKIQHTVAR